MNEDVRSGVEGEETEFKVQQGAQQGCGRPGCCREPLVDQSGGAATLPDAADPPITITFGPVVEEIGGGRPQPVSDAQDPEDPGNVRIHRPRPV